MSVTDHLHLFIGLNPVQSISDLMRQVKGDSREFINKKNFIKNNHLRKGFSVRYH